MARLAPTTSHSIVGDGTQSSRRCLTVDAAASDVHLAPMSTVAEIEAALPELSPQELHRVEVLLHQLQQRQSTILPKNPRLEALDALQARLALDGQKADAWVAAAKDSRR